MKLLGILKDKRRNQLMKVDQLTWDFEEFFEE